MHRRTSPDKPTGTRRKSSLEVAIDIKGRITLAGYTLLDVDRKYGLPRGTAGTTLREPNVAGERAIAAALGTKPELLWQRRYHASGLRKVPQPPENYERVLQRGPRQIDARA